MHRARWIGLALCALAWTESAHAQQSPGPVLRLTFEEAVERASDDSLPVRRAEALRREADVAVAAAGVWQSNPELSGAAGPRFGPTETTVDWSVGVQQWVALGSRPDARRAVARAAADAAEARTDDARRRTTREVAVAFARALYAEERIALAEQNLGIAEQVSEIARRRHEVGDVGGLDESVAALALARAQAELDRSQVLSLQAEADLKVLLALAADVDVDPEGSLDSIAAGAIAGDLAERADLQALRAEIAAARAEGELAEKSKLPDVAFGAAVSREEGASIVKGTLAFTLPFFQRGQGSAAIASARADRLQVELDVATSDATVEVATNRAIARELTAAVRRFEEAGADELERTEAIATRSYEAGAIPLGELLSVRRELLRARVEYTELRLGAAIARIELATTTGELR